MTIRTKRALIVIILLLAGTGFIFPAVYKSRYLKAESLSLGGIVTHIEWKTKNHALPLFEIRGTDGLIHSLNDVELNFKKDQLNVGDTIIKESGSRYCYINKVKIECIDEFIDEFIEFQEAFFRAINDGEPSA